LVTAVGQLPFVPGQLAARVSTLNAHDALRQLTDAASKPSAGQFTPPVVQLSATSQASPAATGRHTCVPVNIVLAGQVVVAPSQFSGGSHTPADARHWTLVAAGWLCVHALLAQMSSEHGLPSSVHAWPSRVEVFAGQVKAPPQVSAGSHRLPSVLARHTVAAGAGASAGHAVLPATHTSAASHTPFCARHVVPTGTVHLPTLPARLQAWQSVASLLPHALLQQTPSAQKVLVQ
jgi:hypothetical protein